MSPLAFLGVEGPHRFCWHGLQPRKLDHLFLIHGILPRKTAKLDGVVPKLRVLSEDACHFPLVSLLPLCYNVVASVVEHVPKILLSEALVLVAVLLSRSSTTWVSTSAEPVVLSTPASGP